MYVIVIFCPVNDKEISGTVPWIDPRFIAYQATAKWIIGTKMSLTLFLAGNLCGQFDTEFAYFGLLLI